MKTIVALLLCALFGSCSHLPTLPPPDDLFHDTAFAAPAVPVDGGAALVLSPAMRTFLATRLPSRQRPGDRRQQLIDALYRGELRLEYDAGVTRTAAQAFDARSGNCLALVLMTAAFAKELDLKVRYQVVVGEESWDRAGELVIAIGHINLVIEERREPGGFITSAGPMVVDFLAPRDAHRLVTEPVAEARVVAMYLNNRAVESLARGEVDTAYWWAREAARTDPQLCSGYVSLGVVYRRHGQPRWAEAALRRVTDREPEHRHALSNLTGVLRELGRPAEADALAQRLARLDPHPPFGYFLEGQAALREGRYEAARRLFAKEVERAPYHHEFEYWLALTYAELDDAERAAAHLRRADGRQHHPQGPRAVRGQAGAAEGAAHAVAGSGQHRVGRELQHLVARTA